MHTAVTRSDAGDAEAKPQNGLAGLKHWRHDLMAGFVVAMISLPFSLGVALASGAPPITGITSAIVAGFILPFLGGSYVTISGPAAGLAPILLSGILTLGAGDTEKGYPLLLVAIFFVGLLQVILCRWKVARFAAIFPAPVVEGMLCAIGLLIIVKQIPLLMGTKFHAKDFWEILAEIPTHLDALSDHPEVIGIGLASLALITILSQFKAGVLKVLPPIVVTVVVGAALARLVGLDDKYLLQLPENPFAHGVMMPHFSGVIADRTLWLPCAWIIIMITLINGVESLATIAAIDKIDPFKRRSDPNRTLLAMGISNFASSIIGGLTIIPGGVKSTANIMAGGRTQWANFYNACFLTLMLLFGRSLINMFPYPVLAAVLAFTGYKLCRPAVWKHMFSIGPEQLLIFGATALITISTDLLVGILAGIAIKLLVNAWYIRFVERSRGVTSPLFHSLASLFRDPIVRHEQRGTEFHLFAEGPLVCFNVIPFKRWIDDVPAGTESLVLHIGDGVLLIDHTTCENILAWKEASGAGGRPFLGFIGWDKLLQKTAHPASMCTLAQ